MAKSASVSQKKEDPKEFDLGFELKNFGPISHADFQLKPLTVFIGPNNSGKSYAALACAAYMDAGRKVLAPMETFLEPRDAFVTDLLATVFKHFPDIEVPQFAVIDELVDSAPFSPDLEKAVKDGTDEFPRDRVIALAEHGFLVHFGARLNRELRDRFGDPLGELTSSGKRGPNLVLRFPNGAICCDLDSKNDLFVLKEADWPRMSVNVTFEAAEAHLTGRGSKLGTLLARVSVQDSKPVELRFDIEKLNQGIKNVAYALICLILGKAWYETHYLPPSRSGILAGHKALAAAVLEQAPFASIRPIQVPSLPPNAANFLADLLRLPEEEGPFSELCRQFEESMTSGEMVLGSQQGRPFPDIKYRFGKREIPLHKASSMVSELAPLFLFLKYKIREGDVLIIEEPGSHLHPGVQRKLAWLLTRLVRRGVRVLITTHSEYLLEQLGNFVMMSAIPGRRLEQKYGYTKEDYLLPEEMGTYLFKYDKRKKGYVTSLLEATAEQGFSEQGFGEVYDELYEESVKLQRDVQYKKPRTKSGVKK